MIEKEEKNRLLTEIFSVLVTSLMASKDGIDTSNSLNADKTRHLIKRAYIEDQTFSSHIDAMVLAAIKILADDFDVEEPIELKLVTAKND